MNNVDFKLAAQRGLYMIQHWLPDGKLVGNEWIARNPTRVDHHLGSFKINMKTGMWSDFATKASGGDAVSLLAYLRRISPADAARQILGIPHSSSASTKKDKEDSSAINDLEMSKDVTSNPDNKSPMPLPKDFKDEKINGLKIWVHRISKANKWEIGKYFPYKNENDEIIFVAVRFNKPDGTKTFYQFTYTEANKWTAKQLYKTNRPLYRLPEILNKTNAAVILHEGEKACEAAIAHLKSRNINHMIATTWSGGANATHKTDMSPLEGRDVYFYPDNDDAGVEAMEKIAQRLAGKAELFWIEPRPNATEGEDAADIDEETFFQMVEGAKPYVPEEKETEKQTKETVIKPKLSEEAIQFLGNYLLVNFQGKGFFLVGNYAYEIGSQVYRDFVSRAIYLEFGKAISDAGLKEIISIHRGHALFASPTRTIYIRVAAVDELKTYIDLADEKGTIIEVTPTGWGTAKNPDVYFKKLTNLRPLPLPDSNGSLEPLETLFNLKYEKDIRLLISVLMFFLRGRPRGRNSYCGIEFYGPEGSAKSTACKKIKHLIDPSIPEVRTFSEEIRDLFIAAYRTHILCADNISAISREFSDGLCSLITGGGFARKLNYSDDDEMIFETCNPVLINGINFKKNADLASRLISFELMPISDEQRKTEAEIWEEMELKRPYILGGLLTALSNSLKAIEKGFEVPPLPRLADFGYFAIAAEVGNNWEKGMTLKALRESYESNLETLQDETPLIQMIYDIVEKTECKKFTGSATKLLEILNSRVNDDTKHLAIWPKTAAGLSGILSRSYNILQYSGLCFETGKSRYNPETQKKERIIEIKQTARYSRDSQDTQEHLFPS